MAILRKHANMDPHVVISQEADRSKARLLGYNLAPVISNQDDFDIDFFLSYAQKTNNQEVNIQEQIDWLEQELSLSQSQVHKNFQNLKKNINLTLEQEKVFNRYLLESHFSLQKYFMENMIYLEMKHLAESIVRIVGYRVQKQEQYSLPYLFKKRKFQNIQLPTKYRGKDYLLELDPGLGVESVWVSDKVLACFNYLREDMSLAQRQLTNSIATCFTWFFGQEEMHQVLPTTIPKIDQDKKEALGKRKAEKVGGKVEFEEYQFCHHCKQYKVSYIMSKCNYSSRKNGLYMPNSSVVNGVSLVNLDPSLEAVVNVLVMKKINRDKKKWKLYEDKLNYHCNKQYCSFCLKNFYDISLQQAQNSNWVCLYCQGLCFCSRCMRQDQLAKIRAYFISLAQPEIEEALLGQAQDLSFLFPFKGGNFFDKIILKNFHTIYKLADITFKDKNWKGQAANEEEKSPQKQGVSKTRSDDLQRSYSDLYAMHSSDDLLARSNIFLEMFGTQKEYEFTSQYQFSQLYTRPLFLHFLKKDDLKSEFYNSIKKPPLKTQPHKSSASFNFANIEDEVEEKEEESGEEKVRLLQEEIEFEEQRLQEARNQKDILIENIKKSSFMNKRDLKAFEKSKELTTIFQNGVFCTKKEEAAEGEGGKEQEEERVDELLQQSKVTQASYDIYAQKNAEADHVLACKRRQKKVKERTMKPCQGLKEGKEKKSIKQVVNRSRSASCKEKWGPRRNK